MATAKYVRWVSSLVNPVVHPDICGPMEVSFLKGSRYHIVFVDDKSLRMWLYFLKSIPRWKS